MSSTNKTAELQLSQFVGTDIPSILTDYNGDMQKIDAGVREVKQATAGAVSDLSSVTARVTNAEQDISGLNTTVQGIASKVITAEGDIDTLQGNVSTINTNLTNVIDNQFKLVTTITTTGMTESSALNTLYQFLHTLSSEKLVNAKIEIEHTIYYVYQVYSNRIALRSAVALRSNENSASVIEEMVSLSNNSSRSIITIELSLPTGNTTASRETYDDDVVSYDNIKVYA